MTSIPQTLNRAARDGARVRTERWMTCMAAGLFMVMNGGCGRDSASQASATTRQAVPVTVASVERRDVPDQVLAIGTVEPVESVMLKPQVDGQLVESRFVEGQEVRAGDLMLVIDTRPFEAELAAAQAALARDTALAEDAERVAQQTAEALKDRASSPREAEKARADADAARAQVESDVAAVNLAKLRLEYCSIRAPISGQAGSLLVKPGNVVKENESELVQINQIAPINVSFAVPEQNLARIRMHQSVSPLSIDVTIPGDARPAIHGSLTFIDNRVDTTTGTIRLKGTFANDDRRLWPGQFVNVVLTVTIDRGALVAPSSAVQMGQKGQFAFVVKPDKTVEQRSVVVSRAADQISVISDGLSEGEVVVTDGQLRLTPGASVEIVNQRVSAERTSP